MFEIVFYSMRRVNETDSIDEISQRYRRGVGQWWLRRCEREGTLRGGGEGEGKDFRPLEKSKNWGVGCPIHLFLFNFVLSLSTQLYL